jgi:hypothetical protein
MTKRIIVGLVLALVACREAAEDKPWKTTDVWYKQSDVAALTATQRPKLVEFFHPD